ncbi:MAG: hypothetical protein COB61_005990 [Thiotrichales bacterium]|nr:hypothetical protein [Thiotrichales bacterium]
MSNKKFIVITSINPPTEAVREFAKWQGWTIVIVGDRKSPSEWHCGDVVYLSIDEQTKQFPEFAALLPENTYLRKMIGYLYAFRHGAEAIFESDDDNIPYPDAANQIDAALTGQRNIGTTLGVSSGWVNIYSEFGASDCWPRGFPLHHINSASDGVRRGGAEDGLPWGVIQYLADEDPDVDAIYRMTRSEPIFFARDRTFRLETESYCPFNSQATLWVPETFPLMFLPIGVTDRVTDILRGYMSLACLWKSGYTLAYASPVVYQERNVHDLFCDFEQEIDLYRFGDAWSRNLLNVNGRSPMETFYSAIDLMVEAKVLPEMNRTAYELFSVEASKKL